MGKMQKLRQGFFSFTLKLSDFFRMIYSSLFFTEKCLVCSQRVYLSRLCKSCASSFMDFAPFGKDRCTFCGRRLLSEKKICSSCRGERILQSTDCVFPLHSYRLWNKKILFDWKMADERTLTPLFARASDKAIKEVLAFENSIKNPSEVCIVPIPPRKGKIKKRGWDQIDELCFYLKNLFGYKIFKGLERLSTVQQKKLDRQQRLAAKGKNYALSKKFYLEKKKNRLPSSVFLIDDLVTTGVTVESAAALLRAGGIKNVKVISLFIVD